MSFGRSASPTILHGLAASQSYRGHAFSTLSVHGVHAFAALQGEFYQRLDRSHHVSEALRAANMALGPENWCPLGAKGPLSSVTQGRTPHERAQRSTRVIGAHDSPNSPPIAMDTRLRPARSTELPRPGSPTLLRKLFCFHFVLL